MKGSTIMCCVTEITLKMETELMAVKALELMKDTKTVTFFRVI